MTTIYIVMYQESKYEESSTIKAFYNEDTAEKYIDSMPLLNEHNDKQYYENIFPRECLYIEECDIE